MKEPEVDAWLVKLEMCCLCSGWGLDMEYYGDSGNNTVLSKIQGRFSVCSVTVGVSFQPRGNTNEV